MDPASPVGQAAGAVGEAVSAIADALGIELPAVGEPVANPAIGASGDDNVIVEFDPLGSPEAIEATNKLMAATGAVVAVAGAVGAAAAAAAAAGAAAGAAGAAGAAAGSAGAASSAGAAAGPAGTGAEMNEDVLDALAAADFEVDLFQDAPPGPGDRLPLFALGLVTALDNISRRWTRSVNKVSPLVSKMINDGVYLRAIFGSLSMAPLLVGIVLAIVSLDQNSGELLHPPVALFMAIAVLGIFDALAGSLAVMVFVLGSLPLVDFGEITDLRMLAGIVVAGFGPIVLARSIRNFRRRPMPGVEGLLARVGDIAFASLMGGWVAGLIVRALPALTGLTLPAANYVPTFQLIATIAIAVRIVLEDFAARLYPQRMDRLAPDTLPQPPAVQVIAVQMMKYFFYVFIASAFMGFGPVVWLASALFMIPGLLGFVADKLPNFPWLWRVLPVGLPGLAMILGLEILLENSLTSILGDDPNFSVIFIYCLLALILVVSVLGVLGREGLPGEERFFLRPGWRWVYRIFGIVVFVLLMQFTSML